ncbi:MAG: DUF4912 domain-containing protein [Elusimicrobiota bacterium]|jgi:hypothetical protein|nr:DUF4912 domain-containing protein [Elusimicrobiota bacterium]
MEKNFSSTAVVKLDHEAVKNAQYDLPQTYGKTESYLLPKDPSWLFLFWDIAKNTFEDIMAQKGGDIFTKSRSIIRVYDIGEAESFDGKNAVSSFDISVVLDAKSWYINVPQSGHRYVCELGIITPNGQFIALTRSNAITLPTGRISDSVDEKWMMVEGDYQKLIKMSGAEMFGLSGQGGASERLQHFLSQKWKISEFDTFNLPSSTNSSWSSHSAAKNTPVNTDETDDIWLKADCELIVYGSASKNAKVFIDKEQINLNPDGTFSLRFSLQEGQKIIVPIKAKHHAKDSIKRAITIKASREKEA